MDNCERRVLRRSWYVPGSSPRSPRRQHVVLCLLQRHPARADFPMQPELIASFIAASDRARAHGRPASLPPSRGARLPQERDSGAGTILPATPSHT